MTISKEKILKEISEHLGIPESEIKSRNRKTQIVKARQIYYFLCFKYCEEPRKEICGLVNHKTLIYIYSVKKAIQEKSIYKATAENISAIEKLIKNN